MWWGDGWACIRVESARDEINAHRVDRLRSYITHSLMDGCSACSAHASLQVSDLPARDLVPGHIVELHVGDRVPADMRILQLRTATLRCEQASLTGE